MLAKMLTASSALRHVIFARRVAASFTLLALVTATGVRGIDDTLQTPTTKTPYSITSHSRSLERRNIHTTTSNNDLHTAYRHNKTDTAPAPFDVGEGRNTTYNYHDTAMTNGGSKPNTDLEVAAQTGQKTEGRNDTSAFSEASSFKELNRGSAQAKRSHHPTLWRSLLQPTTGMESLPKESLLGRFKPLQGTKWKTKNVKTAYFPKTALCNCFTRRIPLTHTPQQRMIGHYRNRNLWLFISYCNKCVSFNNRDKMVFGSYVTYQVCYNSDKCVAYSQHAMEDAADSENYNTSENNDIVDEEIQKRKDYDNSYHLRDGTWSRFRREFNEKDNSTIAVFNGTFIDSLTSVLNNQSDENQNITFLCSDGLDSMDQYEEPGNESELIDIRLFEKPKKLISNGFKFMKEAGHSAAVLSSTVLGTVVSAILNKVGDEEVSDSVREIAGGAGHIMSGVGTIGGKMMRTMG